MEIRGTDLHHNIGKFERMDSLKDISTNKYNHNLVGTPGVTDVYWLDRHAVGTGSFP